VELIAGLAVGREDFLDERPRRSVVLVEVDRAGPGTRALGGAVADRERAAVDRE